MDNLSKSKNARSAGSARDIEDRRIEERFPFSAVTEIVDRSTGTHIKARVSDISLTGCYLDMLNVFVADTKVEIRIRHASLVFEATGTVVYSMPRMGMGISFDPLAPEMVSVLQGWIARVRGGRTSVQESSEQEHTIRNYPRVERHILGRLISLMTRKGVLTSEEGTELLEELLHEN